MLIIAGALMLASIVCLMAAPLTATTAMTRRHPWLPLYVSALLAMAGLALMVLA